MSRTRVDRWDLTKVSINEMITETKRQEMTVMEVRGFTTPEGWPFVVLAAVIKPGQEEMLSLVEHFEKEATAIVKNTYRQDWEAWPGKPKGGS